jgi:hypothetical protein
MTTTGYRCISYLPSRIHLLVCIDIFPNIRDAVPPVTQHTMAYTYIACRERVILVLVKSQYKLTRKDLY